VGFLFNDSFGAEREELLRAKISECAGVHTMFEQTIEILESVFRRLERQVPPPKAVPFKDGFVIRYDEKSIQQALVQKLARMISGIHAARLLLDHGFAQEQSVIERTLDELNEDITFLAAALTNDKITDLHKRYLDSFYEEEFDKLGQATSRKKRNMVPRKKIHAYVIRVLGAGLNPSLTIDNLNTISKVYSGYIHAASPHIMDMYYGNPPQFHIAGLLDAPHIDYYRKDLKNYLYRGLLTAMSVAKAFGDRTAVESLDAFIDKFEQDNPDLLPN
jgi:hypothetical protein